MKMGLSINAIDSCVMGAGMPAPSQIFGFASVSEMISISNKILKAARAAGTEVTFAELAEIMAAEVGAGAAADVVAQAALMAGTLVVSVYIGACITCAASTWGSDLFAELDAAEAGEANELAMAEVNVLTMSGGIPA